MAELVIGSRRSRRLLLLRGAALLVALAVAAVIVGWFIFRRAVNYSVPDAASIPAGEPTAVAGDLRWGPHVRSHRGGLTVLRLDGDAFARGAAHGRLLRPELARGLPPWPRTVLDGVPAGGWFARRVLGMRQAWRTRFLDDGLTPDDAKALAGAAAGAGGDYRAWVHSAAAFDIGVPHASADPLAGDRIAHGLTLALPRAGTTSTMPWFAHTLSAPGLDDGGDHARAHPVVSVVHPQAGLPHLTVGWPGLLGVVTGVNRDGLALFVHPARTRDVEQTRTARPIVALAHEVLSQASTLDDAVKRLTEARTLGAASFVVIDSRAQRWAVVERGPTRARVVTPTPTVISDVFGSADFDDDPENDRARRMRPSAMRARAAARLARVAVSDAQAAVTVLRDRRADNDAVLPVGHRGVTYDPSAIQAVVFDPLAMTVWVADGGPMQRFYAFDLRAQLSDAPQVGASAADVLAADDAARADERAVQLAREDLRVARRQHGTAADAAIARALARRPDLPEARAAMLRATPEGHPGFDAARQAYLEAPPDDPRLLETLGR